MWFNIPSIESSAARQTIAAFVVSLGVFMYGFIQSWIAVTVEEFLSADSTVRLTHEELSWVMALPSLGAVLSPLPATYLMDNIGRRNSLLALYCLPITGWGLVYSASDGRLLAFARLILGFWIGIVDTVVPVYIGEISDPERRSLLNSFSLTMELLGSVAVVAIGASVSYATLAILGFMFSLAFCICLLVIPESPYYYLLVGKKNDALNSFNRLVDDRDVHEKFKRMDKFVEGELQREAKIKDVFLNSGYFKSVLTVILITILVRAGGSRLIAILPILLPKRAFLFLCNNDAFILCQLTILICCFSRSWTIRFGIRKCLVTSCTLCGLMMAVMAVWESLAHTNDQVTTDLYWVPFFSFLIFAAALYCGGTPIVVALKGEMFPTELKSTLSAVTTISSNLSAFVIYKIFFTINDSFGVEYNYVISYVCSFSAALFTYYYIIETEGKSLEQIQNELQLSTEIRSNSDCMKSDS